MCMDNILIVFISMDNDREAKRVMGNVLWGYPDLIKKLFDEVGPALAKDRKKRRRDGEEAEQQDTATDHVDNVPEVVAKENTAPAPSQSSEPTSLDNVSGLPNVRLTHIQLNVQSHSDDHPSTSDEHSLLIATSVTSEALEPSSADPIQKRNAEEVAGTPNDIEEVLSTLDGSRIAQRNEESGE